ncbi:unnamed protein product [Closterium sp. Naga37s-1]|nr:unnamed protein product [Closterium sp. Naga37s-1]
MHPSRACVVELLMEERSGSPARFRIGYALVQKKINSFLQEKLQRESIRKGIELVKIDLSKPLAEQGPFDAILHKIPSQQWYEELEEYQLSRPDVLVIDPPEAIARLYNLYVVGNQVKCLRRKSLPDPQPQDLANPDGLRSFCQVSNLPVLAAAIILSAATTIPVS